MDRFLGVLVMLLVFLLVLGAFSLYDRIITNKRLKISQKDWDEYSKNMTRKQKEDIFCDWLRYHQQEKGWPHLYIPRIHNAERGCDR